jgi:hypothetical protein
MNRVGLNTRAPVSIIDGREQREFHLSLATEAEGSARRLRCWVIVVRACRVPKKFMEQLDAYPT